VNGPTPVAKLEDLISNPAAVNDVPAEAIPALRAKLTELDTLLLARLISSANDQAKQAQSDVILNIEESARRLNRSADWLYRKKRRFNFFVDEEGVFGCSEQGINEWIRQHAGRSK
jgi:hypothetical protein